jgi:DNA-binding NtrC family response regulator
MAERRATVLVVEDQESVRAVTERMLQQAGHVVICCVSAEAALAMLEEPGRTIDVVLSDINLDGMQGPELAAEIRRRRPGTGVILMSGYTEAEAVDRGMEPGTRFLSKPYRIAQLLAAVDAELRAGPGES